MSSSPSESTPEPIYKAALTIGTAVTTLLGVLGAAVTFGIISGEQAEVLTAAGNQIVSALPQIAAAVALVVGLVSGIVGSLATAWHARKKVVPADSDVFDVVRSGPGPLDH